MINTSQIKCYWVNLTSINSSRNFFQFSEQEKNQIETLANSIVNKRGLIVPLILQKIAPNQYKIISGELEYQASIKAKDIDSSLGSVNAFIINKENQEEALAQLKLIRGIYNNEDSKSNQEESNKKLISLVEKLENNFTRDIQELKTKISSLESKLGETKPDDKISPQMLQDIVDDFNYLEIPKLEYKLRLLELPKVGEPTLKTIIQSVQEKRQKGEFKKLNDLNRVKELGEKRIDKIKNSWNQVSPITS